jgi:hypothetical protein
MGVILAPANYRDVHPERGLWVDSGHAPRAYRVVELIFPDATCRPGSWNGKVWSCAGSPVQPLGWRKIPMLG